MDAHADMNPPESSPSGNIHGMPLACCMGIGPDELTHIGGFSPKVDPKNVALVGIRSVDKLEREYVQRSGVRAFTMRDIDERGLRAVMEEAITVASGGPPRGQLSVDIGCMDPPARPR